MGHLLSAMAVVGLGSTLLAELLARTGAPGVRWMAVRPRGPLDRFGLSLLFGSLLLAPVFLGLALTGLFQPAVLAGVTVTAALAGSGTAGRGFLLVRALGPLAGLGRWRGGALAVAALLAVFPVLAPEFESDAVVYHLGMPWQFLLAHRALLTQVPFTFHVPLPVELLFALPLGFGDSRGARALIAWHAAAAAAVFAGRRLARRDPDGAMAGLLLALGSFYLSWLVSVAKSDAAAGAFGVTGALLALDGAVEGGMVLMGAAIAAKVVYGPALVPLAVALVVARRWRTPTPVRRIAGPLALTTLPLLPWVAKSWLATGTPVYPFTASLWPSPDWGPRNAATLREFALESWDPETLVLSTLPMAWIKAMASLELPLLLALPGLLLLPATRTGALAVVVGALAVLATGHLPRFLIPGDWWLAWLAGTQAHRVPRRFRAAGLAILAAVEVGRLANAPLLHLAWGQARRDPAAVTAEAFTTYEDTRHELQHMNSRRVIMVGEWKTWPVPARILYDGAQAETPLMYRTLAESFTVAGVFHRLHQLGADALVYNYVSAEWILKRNAPFQWTDRMVRLYADFCRAGLTRTWASPRCDFINGGYCVYGVARQPRRPPNRTVFHLPGAASVLFAANTARREDRLPECVALLGDLVRRFPDVLFLRGELGYALGAQRRWAEAARVLAPVVRDGTPDAESLPTSGLAAMELGRLDEAEAVLRRCLDIYTTQQDDVRINLAGIAMARTTWLAGRHRVADAAAQLDAAAAWLEPDPVTETAKRRRRSRLAWVRENQADLARARKQFGLAASRYREAAALALDPLEAARDSAAADRMARGPGPGGPP